MPPHDLPCCFCGLPVELDEPEPPGSIAMHARCHEVRRNRGPHWRPGPPGLTNGYLRRRAAGLVPHDDVPPSDN